MSNDLSPAVRRVIAHPRWDPLIGLVDFGAVPLGQLRAADAFFAFLQEGRIKDPDLAALLLHSRAHRSAGPLRTLKKAIAALFPGHPLLLVLEEAVRQKERKSRPTGRAQRTRRLKYSVPEFALPRSFRDGLADMRAGFRRNGVDAPAASIIKRTTMRLRQLAWSSSRRGLPVDLAAQAAGAYYLDITRRSSRYAYIRASFEDFTRFARYTGHPDEIVGSLNKTKRHLEALERLQRPLKFDKMHQHGDNITRTLHLAQELLDQADDAGPPSSRQKLRNAAVALALFSVLPLRLHDTQLRFGEHIGWNGQLYELDTVLHKTERAYFARVNLRLGPFVDALILRGTDVAHLEAMRGRCMASQRPLFVTSSGAPTAYGYVSDLWRAYVGTGAHIARTRIHNRLGRSGDHGVRQAMIMCGQDSPQTAKRYQTLAYEEAAHEAVHDALEDLVDDGAKGYFALD